MEEIRLCYLDGETLMDMECVPHEFCINALLPQGLCILGGAPKVGKSWLVLDWCLRIAKGEPVWDRRTRKGTTLYLCLEDTYERVQKRLSFMTDDIPKSPKQRPAAGGCSIHPASDGSAASDAKNGPLNFASLAFLAAL